MAAQRELNSRPGPEQGPSRAFLPCVVAGMLALAARNVGAREPQDPVQQPTQRPAAAYTGCPAVPQEETFRNRYGTVRESFCSMEITYEDGRTVRFDSSSRSRRGTVRDLLPPGREFSIILTDNYAIVAPGTESGAATSVDIGLPANLRGRPADFDPGSNNLYILSSENELHVINARQGGWRSGPRSEDVNADARLVVFKGLVLIVQSGSIPVIAWEDAVPEEEEWGERKVRAASPLQGPVSVEVQEDRVVLRGQNASVEVTVGVEGDAGSVAVSPASEE